MNKPAYYLSGIFHIISSPYDINTLSAYPFSTITAVPLAVIRKSAYIIPSLVGIVIAV
jgi:hypothetical protein